MTETGPLVCQRANDDQRTAAFRNVHEFWGRGLSVQEHLQQRLASPQHAFATWFVGTIDGRVVASLGGYPWQVNVRATTVKAVAIGAVHTLPEFRGRGYAPQLMAWVERHLADRGVQLSVLFSDIDSAYYARLGYQLCPAYCGWADVNRPEQPTSSPPTGDLILRPWTGTEGQLQSWYHQGHERLPLWVERDEAYWHYADAKQPDDELAVVMWQSRGAECRRQPVGYLRFRRDGAELRIQDLGWATDERMRGDRATAEAAWWPAVRRYAADQPGIERVGGWLPNNEATAAHFELRPRSEEITMIKSLDDSLVLDETLLTAAQYFREIDHV